MPRNLRTESEFGLPALPRPDGSPVPDGATGAEAVTALTDADAIAAGGFNQLHNMGQELREIYARGEGTLEGA